MSYAGRQFNNSFGEDFVYVNKRRQGGNVETLSDLVSGLDSRELEEVVVAMIRGELNQEQQGTG